MKKPIQNKIKTIQVCPFHFLEVIPHSNKDKDGSIVTGFHCPKCFVQNGFRLLRLQGDLPSKK